MNTLPETNIAPENGPLEKEMKFLLETINFRTFAVSFRKCTPPQSLTVCPRKVSYLPNTKPGFQLEFILRGNPGKLILKPRNNLQVFLQHRLRSNHLHVRWLQK